MCIPPPPHHKKTTTNKPTTPLVMKTKLVIQRSNGFKMVI